MSLHRGKQMRLVCYVGLLLLLLGAGCSTVEKNSTRKPDALTDPESYVRIFQADSNIIQLQIALRKFVPERGRRPAVWLAGVSHLGESNYYAALQRHLDKQTLVLFEGIGEHPAPLDATNTSSRPRAESNALSSNSPPASDPALLQAKMASSLGLKFQLEAIEYERANFRNSDLSVRELRDLMAKQPGSTKEAGTAEGFESLLEVMQGNSLWSGLAQLGLSFLSSSPKLQAFGKLALIEMLGQMQGDPQQLQGLSPQIHDLLTVLIQKRNEKVLRDLKVAAAKTARNSSIAVFYGTGHMPDMEIRLRQQLNYRPVEQIWLTAISVNLVESEISPAERSFIRSLIRRQFEVIKNKADRAGASSSD